VGFCVQPAVCDKGSAFLRDLRSARNGRRYDTATRRNASLSDRNLEEISSLPLRCDKNRDKIRKTVTTSRSSNAGLGSVSAKAHVDVTSSAYAARLSLVDLEKQNKTYANTYRTQDIWSWSLSGVVVWRVCSNIPGLRLLPYWTIAYLRGNQLEASSPL